MPRIFRTQKECEQFLIREFLRHLGYRISNPVWQESPDSLLTLSRGKIRKRVAIEHTEYFNDTKAGICSPLTPIYEFWKDVQASLARRISHRKHLTGIIVNAEFKSDLKKPCKTSGLSRQLAMDLVDFMESHPIRKTGTLLFRNHQINSFPMLKDMFSSIQLIRGTCNSVLATRCFWRCSNITTGWITFSLKYVKTAIENKNKKATTYNNWGSANEKWLLITASGANIRNKSGPATQNVNWADSELIDLCRKSPFDRIVFWERSRDWYKWLKPSRKI
jgi:hypothetical protein